MTYPQRSEGTIMLFVMMVEVVWKWPFIHDESLASSFLKSGFQVHSGLDLPAYEDLDIEFFLFRWRYSKTSDATPPCSALVKLLRRFWRAFSCFWSKKRCRALFWFPIDPSPLNVVVLLKPFGHVKNLLWGQTKMADKDFEEFSDNLDELPQHFRATDKTYQ